MSQRPHSRLGVHEGAGQAAGCLNGREGEMLVLIPRFMSDLEVRIGNAYTYGFIKPPFHAGKMVSTFVTLP